MRPSDRQTLRDYCNRRVFIRPSLWHRLLMLLGVRA
jgi:hypothetical protein